MNEMSIYPVRSLHVCSGIGMCSNVIQATPGVFKHFLVESPAVVLVRDGTKTVETPDCAVDVHSGECVFLPEGLECTVKNKDGASGSYHASVLAFSRDIATQFSPGPVHASTPFAARKFAVDGGFRDAFLRATNMLSGEHENDELKRHTLGEIVLRLRGLGIEPAGTRGNRLILEIRGMVGPDMARDWRSADIAKSLGMSEQTLRRRLAENGTTLTETITETRLQTAVALLQSTDLPVTTIAFECGYQSPSKFAARFRSRFGISPSEIRADRSPD